MRTYYLLCKLQHHMCATTDNLCISSITVLAAPRTALAPRPKAFFQKRNLGEILVVVIVTPVAIVKPTIYQKPDHNSRILV